jgi:hypothetical protein
MGKPGEVNFEPWMSIQKGWVPQSDNIKKEGEQGKEEWVIREDAQGRMKAVKEVVQETESKESQAASVIGPNEVEAKEGAVVKEVQVEEEAVRDKATAS